MKLYMNGLAITDSESLARSWKDHEHKVYVIDAEEYVPPAPKPERWAVVDGIGDVLLSGKNGFCYDDAAHVRAMTFPDRDGAERLKDALEAGGMTGLRVVKIEERE